MNPACGTREARKGRNNCAFGENAMGLNSNNYNAGTACALGTPLRSLRASVQYSWRQATPYILPLLLALVFCGCSPAVNKPPDPLRATTITEALAQSNTIENLDLYYRRLNGFPAAILNLKTLKQLNLRTCTLGRLPDEIAALSQLNRLDLEQTGLTNLPPAIGQLPQLTHLWLNDNPLPALPSEIGGLTNLLYLNADRTLLTQLPQGIGSLSNLKWLRLNNNQLTAMPPDMTGLAKNLKVLYLIGNPIPLEEQKRIRAALPGCNVIFNTGKAKKQRQELTK